MKAALLMTWLRLFVVGLALVGIIGPFLIAQKVLNLFYDPSISGTPIPLGAAIAAYGAALCIAVLTFYLCAQWMKQDREPRDKELGLEEKEDLPY